MEALDDLLISLTVINVLCAGGSLFAWHHIKVALHQLSVIRDTHFEFMINHYDRMANLKLPPAPMRG